MHGDDALVLAFLLPHKDDGEGHIAAQQRRGHVVRMEEVATRRDEPVVRIHDRAPCDKWLGAEGPAVLVGLLPDGKATVRVFFQSERCHAEGILFQGEQFKQYRCSSFAPRTWTPPVRGAVSLCTSRTT